MRCPAIADTLTINPVEEELRGPRRCRKSWRARRVASRLVRRRRLHRHGAFRRSRSKGSFSLVLPPLEEKRGHGLNFGSSPRATRRAIITYVYHPLFLNSTGKPREDQGGLFLLLVHINHLFIYYIMPALFCFVFFVCFRTSEAVAAVRLR